MDVILRVRSSLNSLNVLLAFYINSNCLNSFFYTGNIFFWYSSTFYKIFNFPSFSSF